jgi:hypothetical protein
MQSELTDAPRDAPTPSFGLINSAILLERPGFTLDSPSSFAAAFLEAHYSCALPSPVGPRVIFSA